MAPNEFSGGGLSAVFMVVPFLFIGAGLLYLSIAARDKHDRNRHPKVRVLPVGAAHPLSHVRSKMKSTPQGPRQSQVKPSPKRRSEPPWLKRV